MKRLILAIVLVLVLAAGYRFYGGEQTGTGTLTLPQPSPVPGEQAEEFTAETMGREEFELDDGGVYVLAFWTSMNQASDRQRPEFKRLAQRYENQEASFAAVYVNSVPENGEELPYSVLRSAGRLTALYNVKRVPRLFLIEDGRIVLVQNGYHEDNAAQLRDTLREVTQ